MRSSLPWAGERLGPAKPFDVSKLRCPGCPQQALQAVHDQDTGLEIDTCAECLGLWFDPGELRKFFTSKTLKSQFFLDDSVQNLHSIGFTISTRARACPRCRKGMKETLVSDVAVDICSDCQGVWLDHGELKRLVKKYEKGGLQGDARVVEEVRGGVRDESATGRAMNGLLHAFKQLFTKS